MAASLSHVRFAPESGRSASIKLTLRLRRQPLAVLDNLAPYGPESGHGIGEVNSAMMDQLTRSLNRGKGGPACSAAFRASFICPICIVRFFLAGVLLAIRANVSTDGRTALRAILMSSYA